MTFRKKKRCNHRARVGGWAGQRCQKESGHEGMCVVRHGMYGFHWNEQVFSRQERPHDL